MTTCNGNNDFEQKTIFNTLRDYGLTENESKIHGFLAKDDVQRASDISRSLSIQKTQVHRVLKNLERKDMVNLTPEKPIHYTAVPFKKLIELLIKTKKDNINFLEDNKNTLLTQWRSINLQKPALSVEKFAATEGKRNIYSRILQMTQELKRKNQAVTTNQDIIRAEQPGIIKTGLIKAEISQTIEKDGMTPVRVRILTLTQNLILKGGLH